uniref:Pericentrin/AKAP-450 centrosomal targeting domain-containing protein n=1 Tax=Mycena chlorophos TaxID=658473 RepID=A0ABQ0LTX3_MYCCL|nr:predicted protein [Mycena chlorophos]
MSFHVVHAHRPSDKDRRGSLCCVLLQRRVDALDDEVSRRIAKRIPLEDPEREILVQKSIQCLADSAVEIERLLVRREDADIELDAAESAESQAVDAWRKIDAREDHFSTLHKHYDGAVHVANSLVRRLRREEKKNARTPAFEKLLRRSRGAWSPIVRAAQFHARRFRAKKLAILRAALSAAQDVLTERRRRGIRTARKIRL